MLIRIGCSRYSGRQAACRRPRWHSGSVSFGPCTAEISQKTHTFTLLIDGDSNGPLQWFKALEVVRNRGIVTRTCVFAAPKQKDNPKWNAALIATKAEFIPVPRFDGGSGAKDPTDIAIAMEGMRVVCQKESDAIALLTLDSDFVFMARQLLPFGCRVLAVLPEGSKEGLAAAFTAVGAEVARFSAEIGEQRRPTMKAVLNTNGESALLPLTGEEDAAFGSLEQSVAVVQILRSLKYMTSADDPLMPAIAKFYHVNSIGPLIVWPETCLKNEAFAAIARNSDRAWKENPGNLAFVFPRAASNTSKAAELRYGTRSCASMVSGGGPFIISSSDKLVEVIFERLGFLNADLNADVAEAVTVFCDMGMNYRALTSVGLPIAEMPGIEAKKVLLHSAFLSTRLLGQWQVAPNDTNIRALLATRNLIRNRNDSPEMVFQALQEYAMNRKLKQWRTYNGLMQEVLKDLNAPQPVRRR